MTLIRALAAAVAVVAWAQGAAADLIPVPGAFPTIQAAIDAPSTNDGDVIVLVNALYNGPGNTDVTFRGKLVTVRSSSGDPTQCRIDCAGSSRAFLFENGESRAARIQGIEIHRGQAMVGGGILIVDSSPTVMSCLFTENEADTNGGAIYAVGGEPVIDDSAFSGNGAAVAGGAAWCLQSNASFTGCLFEANASIATSYSTGGAIYAASSDLRIAGCSFLSNTATFSGGAVSIVKGEVRVCNSVFTDNEAAQGGGLHQSRSMLLLDSCTFVANVATNEGGGVYLSTGFAHMVNCVVIDNEAVNGGGIRIFGESPKLINCTMSRNTASLEGGGVYSGDTVGPNVHSCILWANVPNQVFDLDDSLTVSYSNVQNGWTGLGANNIDADPLFADPGTGDFRLSAGSPSIDAGDNRAVPVDIVRDRDRRMRFVDDPATPNTGFGTPPVDMGAYEFLSDFCLADVNGDGVVDMLDVLDVLTAWGQVCVAEDVNGDGRVDVLDLLELLLAWGPCV